VTPSILVVDDDVGMAETLSDILAAKRFDVTTTASGEGAIAEVNRHTFALVLMDIRMPGINGVQALQSMRRDHPAIKVIMMTAFTRDELVEEARRASALAIVPKPLDLDFLLSLIDTVVGSPT